MLMQFTSEICVLPFSAWFLPICRLEGVSKAVTCVLFLFNTLTEPSQPGWKPYIYISINAGIHTSLFLLNYFFFSQEFYQRSLSSIVAISACGFKD